VGGYSLRNDSNDWVLVHSIMMGGWVVFRAAYGCMKYKSIRTNAKVLVVEILAR